MQNFKIITREFINQQAIVQVTDEFELANCLHALFGSDEIRRELSSRAKATFEANLGAAQRTARIIVQSLENQPKDKTGCRLVPAVAFPGQGGVRPRAGSVTGRPRSRCSSARRQSDAAFCSLLHGVSTK